jgi:hypothetical protein
MEKGEIPAEPEIDGPRRAGKGKGKPEPPGGEWGAGKATAAPVKKSAVGEDVDEFFGDDPDDVMEDGDESGSDESDVDQA